ncbi:MAG: outer membrane beta-barrel protein [Bacteroidota bacterium]
MNPKQLLSYFLIFFSTMLLASAQKDSTKLELSGYVDTYYSRYSSDRADDSFPQYVITSPRHNEFGLNIAQIGAHYEADKIRGSAVIHFGDIPNVIWSPAFPAIQQAWVGTKITEGLWLDGGFFLTHIGTESFAPKDNFLSTTAVATFIDPFFQSGLRLTYDRREKFKAELHLVNGLNRFEDDNGSKSIGVFLSYDFSDKFTLCYSNLYGTESSFDSGDDLFYNNLYANWNFAENFSLLFGGNLSTLRQFSAAGGNANQTDNNYSWLYSALATVNYRCFEKVGFSARYEFFKDEDGFLSGTFLTEQLSREGPQLQGLTFGVEYNPTETSYIRSEYRLAWTQPGLLIFREGSNRTNNRQEFSLTMGFYFRELINR